MKSVLNIHCKAWCWSWSSSTLATWCKELTQLKIPWCWEWLKVGGEGDDREWDSWMVSLTQWTWVWVSSGSWWWTGKPGVLQSMGSQRVRHYWVTELKWIELIESCLCYMVVMSSIRSCFFLSFILFTEFSFSLLSFCFVLFWSLFCWSLSWNYRRYLAVDCSSLKPNRKLCIYMQVCFLGFFYSISRL